MKAYVRMIKQGGDPRGRMHPCTLGPEQAALCQWNACQSGGFGSVDCVVERMALCCEQAVAMRLLWVMIQMQHATALPRRLLWQTVCQQPQAEPITGQQQMGLLGRVRRDFGVNQTLPIAGWLFRRRLE